MTLKKRQTEKPFREGIIGKEAEIKTKNKSFKGKITFETKNTIKIITELGEKTVMKKDSEITIKNKKIKGNKITRRTEDRIKTR